MPMSASWAQLARVQRRTGFGTTGAAVDAAMAAGPDAYIAGLFATERPADPGVTATPMPTFTPIPPVGKTASKADRAARNQQVGAQLQTLTDWWVRRMAAVTEPFEEKLTFCWHNHFATAATKVREASWLAAQNSTLRTLGRGDFRALALAMLTDAAMLRWLDGEQNTAAAPNENLSREFMELFALGHGDGYTETDVREGARALTGWVIKADGGTALVPKRHDNRSKSFLGVTGDLDQTGYCDAVLARSASAGFLATRWWGQLGSDTAPSSSLVARLATAYGANRSISALLRALVSAPEFTAAQGSSVVNPVEWLIGAVRALKVPTSSDAQVKRLVTVLRALGQVPFYPPNVSGWPAGQAWLSTAAADVRMQTAAALATGGDVSPVADAAPAQRLDAAAHLLGIASWSDRSAAVLKASGSDPHKLIVVGLNTPEYLTN
ncbi:MAG: DUF1800 domain-containing protein [Actinobacteria bacterium]|nr:DUF1800 domain-containing protein [Actinomycetota bacterium]